MIFLLWVCVLVGWLLISCAIGIFQGLGYGLINAGVGFMLWSMLALLVFPGNKNG